MTIYMNASFLDEGLLSNKPFFTKSENSDILGFAAEIYGYGQSLLKDLDFKNNTKKEQSKELPQEKKW